MSGGVVGHVLSGGMVALLLCLGCGARTSGQTTPMNVVGVGDCDAVLGVRWGGERCEVVSGCSCEGADCDGLFDSMAACEQAMASP